MTKEDAIEYFGGTKHLAAILDVWPHTIYAWKKIPIQYQYTVYVKSDFKLTPDDMQTGATT